MYILSTVPTVEAISNDLALKEQCVVETMWMVCEWTLSGSLHKLLRYWWWVWRSTCLVVSQENLVRKFYHLVNLPPTNMESIGTFFGLPCPPCMEDSFIFHPGNSQRFWTNNGANVSTLNLERDQIYRMKSVINRKDSRHCLRRPQI